MRKLFRSKASLVGIALASGGLLSLNTLAIPHLAGADPAYPSSFVAVGSDTIQDVYDAFAGRSNNVSYAPLTSTGGKTIVSWSATPPGSCITPKPGGQVSLRPNGSGAGVNAVREAQGFDPTPSANFTCPGNAAPVLTSAFDIARSSSAPSDTSTTDLTWIPFGRDGVSFGYYDHVTGAISTLSLANIQAAYSNTSTGTVTVGTETVKACLPQASSGTRKFWITAIGVPSATADLAATAAGCNGTIPGGTVLEENNANLLATFGGTLPANTDAIIPFSCASWIAQANGVAVDNSATGRSAGVDEGIIAGKPKCYTGTAPTEAPDPTFYSDPSFGRYVWSVAKTTSVTGIGDAQLKSLLVGATSKICSAAAQVTVNKFGFLSTGAPLLACGDTSTKGKK